MNLLGRLWKALIDDYPTVPDSADLDDGKGDVGDHGPSCRWFTASCRCPLNDENMPSGCDARCPARLQVEQRARELSQENNARMFF